MGAYVSGSSAWRLFVRSGNLFHQVLFFGKNEPSVPPVSDFMRADGQLKVVGDQLVASYGNDASGKNTVVVSWRLTLPEFRADLLTSAHENRDPRK